MVILPYRMIYPRTNNDHGTDRRDQQEGDDQPDDSSRLVAEDLLCKNIPYLDLSCQLRDWNRIEKDKIDNHI